MKMKNKIQTATILIISIFLSSLAFSAGMQTQLDNIYLEMENYTAPGSIETQRRSAYFGGRYTYKTQIYSDNLVAMQLPSAKGGCGGIDVFGGSFSFVHSDQIVQLLRQVAANAKGYAFQLAMDNMCPDCIKWMNELQTKVQSMNENLSNSCQLAQGIINDTSNMLPFKVREKTNYSIKASLAGVGEDFGDLVSHIGSADTAVKRLFDSDPDSFDESTGSVVYKALKQHSAENWFAGGDEELIETIMSMTGTVVVGDLITGAEGDGDTTQIWILPGNKLTIKDMIDGAVDREIYDCSADEDTAHCRISPSDTRNITISGLKEKILTAFTGPNGLITWIRLQNVNGNLSQEQLNVLAAMPHAIGSKIFQLAPLSPEAAEQLVTNSIDAISLEYVHRLVRGSFDAVQIALANHQNNYKQSALQELEKARSALNTEYLTLSESFGSIKDIEAHYNEIIKNVQKPRYLSADALLNNKPE